jgi:hypothetical protein
MMVRIRKEQVLNNALREAGLLSRREVMQLGDEYDVPKEDYQHMGLYKTFDKAVKRAFEWLKEVDSRDVSELYPPNKGVFNKIDSSYHIEHVSYFGSFRQSLSISRRQVNE